IRTHCIFAESGIVDDQIDTSQEPVAGAAHLAGEREPVARRDGRDATADEQSGWRRFPGFARAEIRTGRKWNGGTGQPASDRDEIAEASGERSPRVRQLEFEP